MPNYTYPDGVHDRVEYHAMGTHPVITCPECGQQMTRKYTAPRVNWNGLRPSQGEMSPTFKEYFNTVDRRREAYAEQHEAKGA